jgi:hypothetical protein
MPQSAFLASGSISSGITAESMDQMLIVTLPDVCLSGFACMSTA